MSEIYAALEIGTSRTALAVGETVNGRLRVTRHAEIPSTGVRKSLIIDVNQATQSVRSVLKAIENQQDKSNDKISIGLAYLVMSGQGVDTCTYQSQTQIEGAKVSQEDMHEVEEGVRTLVLPKDREILDIVDQDYAVDSVGGILNPREMTGSVLKLNAIYIHTDSNCVSNARTATEQSHLEIKEPLFATTCAAEAVLEEHERRNGVLVLDLGAGSTGYAAYTNGHLATAGVIGVGGDHVSNDIAQAFQTPLAQAEVLKMTEASAVLNAEKSATPRIQLPGSSTLMTSRTISRLALDTVVNVRLRELLSIIREQLDGADLMSRLHSVVITGGGAALRNISQLIERELGMSVRTGSPIHVDGLSEVPDPARFAALAGALLYASHDGEEKSLLKNILGGLFR